MTTLEGDWYWNGYRFGLWYGNMYGLASLRRVATKCDSAEYLAGLIDATLVLVQS